MQLNDLLVKNLYVVLKECISFDTNDIQVQTASNNYTIYRTTWELFGKKYTRLIECEVAYIPVSQTLMVVLKTNEWFMQNVFKFNALKLYIQCKTREEAESELQSTLSSRITLIETCFFEMNSTSRELKKRVINDIKTSYSWGESNSCHVIDQQIVAERKFAYESDCFLSIIHTLITPVVHLCYEDFVIGFVLLDGTSAFNPILNEQIISQHRILINRGYNKLITDLTIGYKSINRNEERNVFYNNDKFVLNWFKEQLSDDGLYNIFNDIDAHLEISAPTERAYNILKSIRQDLRKIFSSIENIFYLERLVETESEKAYLSQDINQDRKGNYQGNYIEFIIIKYRSILDYSIELIKEIFPETEGNKLQGKFEYFNDVMKNNSAFDKSIMSSNWFQAMKSVRDNVIHHGATCKIYDTKKLGFQMYDLELEGLIYFDEDYMQLNENIVRVDRFLITNMSYLYYFLHICFASINKKIKKQDDCNSKTQSKQKGEKECTLYKEEIFGLSNEIFRIPISSLLLEWCNDLLDEFK